MLLLLLLLLLLLSCRGDGSNGDAGGVIGAVVDADDAALLFAAVVVGLFRRFRIFGRNTPVNSSRMSRIAMINMHIKYGVLLASSSFSC